MEPLKTVNTCIIYYFPSLSCLFIFQWKLCRVVLIASTFKICFSFPLLCFSVMELLPSIPATRICCSQERCQCSQWSCVWLWFRWALWYPRKGEKVGTFHVLILCFFPPLVVKKELWSLLPRKASCGDGPLAGYISSERDSQVALSRYRTVKLRNKQQAQRGNKMHPQNVSSWNLKVKCERSCCMWKNVH